MFELCIGQILGGEMTKWKKNQGYSDTGRTLLASMGLMNMVRELVMSKMHNSARN